MILALFLIGVDATRATADPAPPLPTYSYYMSTDSQSTLYHLGLVTGEDTAAGDFPQHALIILDWGNSSCGNSGCGTYLPGGTGAYVTTADSRAASEQFADGYYVGTGSDTSANAFVAMGTSNYGSQFSSDSAAQTAGSWWSGTMTAFQDWITSNNIATQVTARGAIDAELEWSAPGPALSWASAYQSSWTQLFWDFGNATSCSTACGSSWTMHDVWTMSYGATPAMPFPEVYNSAQAADWGEIARYAYNSLGSSMQFEGPVSQYQACADTGQPCSGADNTPTQSWDDLYNSLNCGANCPVPQSPGSVTDIRWKLYA